MGKVIANILLGALTIALTIFTASRTLDLLSQWLPVQQGIYVWLGLAAFEGGFLMWCLFFANAAKGSIQRGVALLMVVFCFLGIAVATISDLVLTGAKDGKLPPINENLQEAIVVFIGLVIVINVAAFAATKLISPDKLQQWARQDAEDKIFEEEHKAIRELAPYVAANMAPMRAQQWAQQTWDRLLPSTAASTYRIEDVTPAVPAQLPTPRTQASFAQTGTLPPAGSIDRPNAVPESHTSNKRNVFQRAKDAVAGALGNANDNQPHLNNGNAVDETIQSSTAATPASEGSTSVNKAPRPFHSGSGAAARQRANARRQRRNKRKHPTS
jgi:hypothetical protein